MKNQKNLICIYSTLTVLFMGCGDEGKFIHYDYHGVTVTRVNNYPEDYFYYGKFDNTKDLPKGYILSKFSGFDGLMSAFLIFKKDKTVEIIPVADDFSQTVDNRLMKLNDKMENIDFIHWRDRIRSDMDSVVELSDVIKLEITRNKTGHSKVNAKYDKTLLEE